MVDFKKQENWRKKPPKRMGNCRKVRCYIFSCKDIPSADDDGQSDCYIKIFNQDGDNIKTIIVPDSLNPIFYECKEFFIEFDSL